MTILQLEYFLAVVNHGSFSAASRHCFISQPSLSIQIQRLEKELGVVLLDRNSKPVVPTEEGLPILEQARNTVEAFRAVKEKVNERQREVSGKLRLGIIPLLSPYILPKFIPEFVRRCPDVELEIRDVIPADLVEAFNRNLIDVAILFGGGEPQPNIVETKLFIDNLYVYVSPRNKLYGRDVLCESDLDLSQMLVVQEDPWMCEKRYAAGEARKQAKAPYLFMHTSIETLIHMVDVTSTFTIVPGMAIDYIAAEKHDRIKVFNQSGAHRTVTMAVVRNYMRNKVIDAVRESFMVVAEQNVLAELLRK